MPDQSAVCDDHSARLHNAQLLRMTRAFACGSRKQEWWGLASTLAIFAALLTVAGMDRLPWLARVPASILAGLTLVRLFIFYHDFQHGTILKGSWLAGLIMTFYGLITLNPPSIWKRSHNHHHKSNAKLFCASIGSYPLMTVSAYQRASRGERFVYAVSRHPLTIALGYLTVFLYGMCIRSLWVNPKAHFDSVLAVLLHLAVAIAVGIVDLDALFMVILIPSLLAAGTGAYFFYAQHNYPDMKVRDRARWDFVAAALESSSYVRQSRLLHWFTGNIAYHHVHHLNAHIPFYRLPEAMAALPQLQTPGTTSLSLRDIAGCLRLKLWDHEQGRLVNFQGV